MVFDQSTKIYVPVAWILMTGKTQECYWQAFNWLTSAVPTCNPSFVGVDFERAFFTMVGIHFPDAVLVGCLFHFKQAVRRKMLKMGIPDLEVQYAMRHGVVDLITVIPNDELGKGMAFIRSMITEHITTLYPGDGKTQLELHKR